MPFGGKWCLPGGSVKFGEGVELALKREIKEEIGLEATELKLLFFKDEHFPKLNISALVLIFLVNVKGKSKTNFEVTDIKWFSKKEIENLKMAYSHNDVLKRYFKEK